MIRIVLGVACILLGLKVLIVHKFQARGGIVDFSSPFLHYPIGLLLIGMGVVLLGRSLHRKT